MINPDKRRRILEEADYIVKEKCTIRSVARAFNISKTQVHIDLTVDLRSLSLDLYKKVRMILDYNKSVRHIRGGQATAKKGSSKRK